MKPHITLLTLCVDDLRKLRLDQVYVRNCNFVSDLDVIILTLITLLPRLRFDQLLVFSWKILLPLSFLNIVVTGGIILAVSKGV